VSTNHLYQPADFLEEWKIPVTKELLLFRVITNDVSCYMILRAEIPGVARDSR
jgi:hypothetical protein